MVNDRIARLRAEAALWMANHIQPDDDSALWEKQCDEKFAELIIKECVIKMASESLKSGVEGAIEKTFKHFGVE